MGTNFTTIRSLDCSVPQGSLAGPNLYSAYASTMQEVVPDDMGLNGFADDHSLIFKLLKQMTGRQSRQSFLPYKTAS